MARIVYFNNDYVDQIAFRSGVAGDGIPEFINIDGSKADGVELEWALQRGIGGVTAARQLRLRRSPRGDQHQHQPAVPAGPAAAAAAAARRHASRLVRARPPHAQRRRAHRRRSPRPQLPVAAHGSQRWRCPRAMTTDITVNPGYTVIGAGADVAAHERVSICSFASATSPTPSMRTCSATRPCRARSSRARESAWEEPADRHGTFLGTSHEARGTGVRRPLPSPPVGWR